MNVHVLLAIFRRNFVSYFSNPTGYVFICVFVLLNSFAAFWPNDFFNANLANLDQLNKWLPYILLVFIPAITMSIWADERRLGTDELLLTIPAGDFEVVLGKYLAAVAIYSCALVFSALSNLAVLAWLGRPDYGLFLGNYFGYWMVGLTMLSIGMVASFLTSNITVGFVLGAVFNTPLVFAAASDVVLSSGLASSVKRWSIEAAFRDFGRGVVSLSSLCYFTLITVVMIYLSVVLIGRRHWWGGRDGHAMLGHYIGRTVALVFVALGLTIFFTRYDARADVTSEQLTALSPKTKDLLKKLEPKDKIIVEAFVTPDMPENFVQTRLDLLNLLREMESRAGDKIDVRIHDTDPFSPAAQLAEDQYEITSQRVFVRTSGAVTSKEIYCGVAVSCGGDKVVIPFINRGIPVEYELIRSIATVGRTKDDRPKLGVIRTDAYTNLDNSREGMLKELRKQYDVEPVDADKPIQKKYDVVLAVQPSSLSPPQMTNFIDMVKRGQATAIFEDPFPYFEDFQGVPGTTDPKRAGGDPRMQMFGGGGPPQPTGDIGKLGKMLGVPVRGDELVVDKFNPYKQRQDLPLEFVFANAESGAKEPFSAQSPITNGLQEMAMLCCGWLERGEDNGLTYTPLISTSKQAARIMKSEAVQFNPFGGGSTLDPRRVSRYRWQTKEQVVAAQVRGHLKSDAEFHPGHDDDKKGDDKEGGKAPEVNVVVVADIDCLSAAFLQLRAEGSEDRELAFNFDNVTFVLNTLDDLAADERFIEIRTRRRRHRTLSTVEETSRRSVAVADEKRDEFQHEFERKEKEANDRFKKQLDEIDKLTDISEIERMQRKQLVQSTEQKKLDAEISHLKADRDREIRKIDIQREQSIRGVRNIYKYVAVVLPPIIPLLIGIVVFFNRRSKEREGVPEQRLRQGN